MRTNWMRRLGALAVAAWVGTFAAAGSTGCASERPTIDRVQANAIRKSDLVGDFRDGKDAPEFYMRSLVLAVQRTNPFTSDGIQDLTRRVRFEVQEHYLIARNAYEYVTTSDGQGGPRGKTNDGLIVSIWPITSHFDVRRSYNTMTGEEANVVEENSTDRPWFEREYMRVDWSRNLVTDPNAFIQEGAWGDNGNQMHLEPVAFYENDPNRWDASNFAELGDGYFDLTSKWLFKPASTTYYDDWGVYDIPDCLLTNGDLYPNSYVADPSIDCGSQEITIRTGFWKVPTGEKSTDYETMEIQPWQGNILGTINLDRSGYDRQYGIVDPTWHRFVQRYNIWKKSHTDTECGQDENKTNGDAACAAINANSVCDMNAKRCTIPYTDRQVAPIAFFVDPDMPQALYESTQKSVDEWSRAITRGVAYAREAECRRTGGDRDGCHAQFFDGPIDVKKEDQPKADQGPTVVLCHNPVIDGDHPACGAKDTKVRKGDIRHHMIAWWDNPSFERPLGVIVPSGDPVTGENIGSIVNIFGASVETYSARARDQLQLINGDFSPSEYAAGLPRKLYDEGRVYDTDPLADPVLDAWLSVGSKMSQPASTMTRAEIDARIKAIDVKGMQAAFGWSPDKTKGMTDAQRKLAWYGHVQAQSTAGTPGFASAGTYSSKIAARVDALQKAGLEEKVASPEWMAGAGVDPRLASDPRTIKAFSPLSGANPTRLALRASKNKSQACKLTVPELLRFDWQAGYAAKMKARYPDGAVASGDIAKAAGVEGQTIDRVVRGKLIYRELLAPMYEFTLLHEMGHLMSMEHDFSGSWDSPNFETEYWILRANGDKKNMVACPETGRDPATDNCMGPRWLDPATTDELGTTKGKEHDSIDSYAVASVMDYKFDSLYSAKLGPMDKMAAKYIYTGLVELFDDDQYSLIKGSSSTGTGYLSSLGLLNSEAWFFRGNEKHYTEVARDLNLFDPARCRPQTEEEKAAGTGALGFVCAPVHKDHSFLRDMDTKLPSGGWPADFAVRFAKDKLTGKIRWPYKVGDGETAYVHQWMYDNGADFYEITKDILERYELMYLDSFFRKGSRERDWESLPESLYDRFFTRVQSLQWNALADIVPGGAGITVEGPDFSAEGKRLSLIMLFDSMQRALLRPQPGAYALNKPAGAMYDVYSSISDQADPKAAFNLGAGDARYIDSKFDLTKQYDFLAYGDRIGTYVEKPLAAIALTDSRPQLSTVERLTYLDGRNVMFSFRQAIPEAFDRMVAGVLADDWDTVAPYVTGDPDPSGISALSTLNLWEPDVSKIVRPAGSKIVDPMMGYRVKYPTFVLMMLYQPIDTNMELVNRTRIWREGAIEAIKVPDAERVTFFDPVDGVEWTSRTFGTETLAGKLVEKGIGARMLQHANELLAAAYPVDVEPVAPGSTQMKPKYGADRRPQKTGGGVLTALDAKDATAAAKLRDYVAFLNQVRQVFDVLGFGPCGRGESC